MRFINYCLLALGLSLLLFSCNSGDMTCTCEYPEWTGVASPTVSICTECEGTSAGTQFEESCVQADTGAQVFGGSCTLTID